MLTYQNQNLFLSFLTLRTKDSWSMIMDGYIVDMEIAVI